MTAIDDALAGMDARARALLQRLAERDRVLGLPRLSMRWPAHVPRTEAADYWREPKQETPCRR